MRKSFLRGVSLSFCLAVAACSPSSPAPSQPATTPSPPLTPLSFASHPAYAQVLLDGAPEVRQKPDFCGEACAEMALRRLGWSGTQDDVYNLTGIDPALGRGATTIEMKRALEALGFDVGAVWYSVDARDPAPGLEAMFAAAHADLIHGIPSIWCTHYDERPDTTEHFRLLLGYDAARDEIVYSEPAEDHGAYKRMTRARMLTLWPLKYEQTKWTVIRLRLEPRAPKPPAPVAMRVQGFSPADYAQHVLALRERLPPGFSVVVSPPFVVAGDEPPRVVAERAQNIVRWATEKLEADFFARAPRKILDVWLFKDKPSYEGNTRKLFGEDPSTPYGYYSPEHGALIMNIATGGGTLVHEIVHPFVEADFPDAPAWLNEGLGSLFEQSGEREGHIIGHTNWRLAGLQEAIKRRQVPSFKALTSTTSHEFYDEDRGTNYAEARYLFHYLQEKGLLVRFYREARDHHATDPTGYETLKRVLGETDMDAFKSRWETYVSGLRFSR